MFINYFHKTNYHKISDTFQWNVVFYTALSMSHKFELSITKCYKPLILSL